MNDKLKTDMVLKNSKRLLKQIENIPLTGPDLDDAFYVFALRITSEDSVGKRKLTANKYYYFLDGFTIYDDRILVSKSRYKKTIYDYYPNVGQSSKPHVSISAIVGENGAGKSSLIEFELRLINNFSSILFGEDANIESWPHLHFIDGVNGELYYVLGQNVYCLSVKGRDVKLFCYYSQVGEENGNIVFLPYDLPHDIIHGNPVSPKGTPIRSVYHDKYFESLTNLLPSFFYTVVLNQSVYAYNTNDFKSEGNGKTDARGQRASVVPLNQYLFKYIINRNRNDEVRVYIEDYMLSDKKALQWLGKHKKLKYRDQEAYDEYIN